MLTLFRLTAVRFLSVAFAASFIAMGCFDTAQGQTLTVSNANLTFTAAQGNNPSPPTQQVSIGSTGASINYLISTDQRWLLASSGPFGGTGGTSGIDPLTIQINSISLNAGTYTGIVTLTPTNGVARATITVTLTISGSGPASRPHSLHLSPSSISRSKAARLALPLKAFKSQAQASTCQLPRSASTYGAHQQLPP